MSSSQEVRCCASPLVFRHEAADVRVVWEAQMMAGCLFSPYLDTAACWVPHPVTNIPESAWPREMHICV